MGYIERPIPTPNANEVLVKLEYVGICGSDMHYYKTGAIGVYVVEPPFVFGHEPGGTVVEVGENVKHLVSRRLKLGIHPADLSVEQMYAVGSFAATAASLSTEKSGGIPSLPHEEKVQF